MVTEVCTNLLKHAGGGEVLLRMPSDDTDRMPSLEFLALDKARAWRIGAMPAGRLFDRQLAWRGIGRHSRGSPHESDFYSVPGKGTALSGPLDLAASKPLTHAAHAQSANRRRECRQARPGSLRRFLGR